MHENETFLDNQNFIEVSKDNVLEARKMWQDWTLARKIKKFKHKAGHAGLELAEVAKLRKKLRQTNLAELLNKIFDADGQHDDVLDLYKLKKDMIGWKKSKLGDWVDKKAAWVDEKAGKAKFLAGKFYDKTLGKAVDPVKNWFAGLDYAAEKFQIQPIVKAKKFATKAGKFVKKAGKVLGKLADGFGVMGDAYTIKGSMDFIRAPHEDTHLGGAQAMLDNFSDLLRRYHEGTKVYQSGLSSTL